MKSNLRILLLEDDVADAEMIAQELERAGFSSSLARVQTEAEFRHELDAGPPDLILSDHGLSAFNGFMALEIAREVCPELPFIFVSGSNNQGMVAEMYELGATDYVFKRDLGDLKSAVRSALEPKPEATPPVEFRMIPGQPELNLQLPNTPSRPAVSPSAVGLLLFCPQCRQAWDEAGQVVRVEDYCCNRVEIVVLRQLCGECKRSLR